MLKCVWEHPQYQIDSRLLKEKAKSFYALVYDDSAVKNNINLMKIEFKSNIQRQVFQGQKSITETTKIGLSVCLCLGWEYNTSKTFLCIFAAFIT